jgi:hypothetical protein
MFSVREMQKNWLAGAHAAIENVKNLYRARHSGGCRMPSQGDKCDCFLCACDNTLQSYIETDKRLNDGDKRPLKV